MPRKPKEGDIFEIPLSDGRKVYGQYLNYSEMGPLIQVFDFFVASTEEVVIEQVLASRLMFPPVITGLFAAIKEKYWRVISHQPIANFIHPKFVSTFYDQNTGKASIWFLWDGQKEIRIGAVLPDEYKKFEFLVVWNPSDVVQRIETGELPFPYADLIKNNEFAPVR